MIHNVDVIRVLSEEWTRCRSRNPAYSMRAFARRLHIPVSALSEILSGRRRVTPKMAMRILNRIEVPGEKAQELIRSLRPPSRLRGSKEYGNRGVVLDKSLHLLSMDQFHLVADWQYFAVLVLAETEGFRDDPAWIAARLQMTQAEAKTAIECLGRLGLLKQNEAGNWESTGSQVRTTTDIENLGLRRGHEQNLDLARRSLENDELLERDFSSITVATTRKKMEEAKKMIKLFRRRLWKFLETGQKEEVYQLQIQFFPLSKKMECAL